METLATHYARLLGTDDSWRVEAVDLRLEDRQVEIRLKHVGSGIACPECGRACGLADHADERRWRHLDTMQFTLCRQISMVPASWTSFQTERRSRQKRSSGP
jgi:hypothetical protein